MYSLARKMLRSDEQAEDLVHEVFAKLLDKSDTLNNVNNLQGYLFKITENMALTRLKQKSREFDATREYVRLMEVADTDDVLLDSIQDKQRLDDLLKRLPPAGKMAFELVKLKGLSYKEAAEHMSISRHTVHVHITRSMQFLRKHFSSVSMLIFTWLVDPR
jgi:RNA polymerase sigma-70 factor (ECF subfamily)